MKLKLDLTNKKQNIALSAILLAIMIAVAIIMGYQYHAFSAYQAWFYTGNVDETQKFDRYSETLKGTAGDSEIYVIKGTENTVALTTTENAEKYDSLEKLNVSSVKAVGVIDSEQLIAAEKTMDAVFIDSVSSAAQAVSALENGIYDVAILSYADAKEAISKNDKLCVSEAEVEKVPKVLVLGGTHPNEPAGQLAATVFLENAHIERGILYVITELNKSAYTHSQPQEATTWYYDLTTKSGSKRTFKFGARATNTNQQWPNPDVYVHSSGQNLSSTEVRNINRAYPGSPTGNYTERVAYAVAELVRENDITVVIDLHEAAPEYITINAMVAHDDANEMADIAGNWLMADYSATDKDGNNINGVKISVEKSPQTLHGLTHRELGDYTNAYVFLCETSNASQGKLRGAFTEDLITYSKTDKFYEYAAQWDGLLYARPVSINERVARHVLSVESIIEAFNESGYTRNTKSESSVNKLTDDLKQSSVYVGEFRLSGVPEYVNIIDNGVGYYLADKD